MNRLLDRFRSNEFARHVLTLLSGTALAQLLAMVAMLVVAQFVNDDEMGYFTSLLAVIMFLVPVAAGRYDLAIVLPDSDDDARQLVRLATLVNTVVCALATVGLLLVGGALAAWMGIPGRHQVWIYLAGVGAWLFAEVVLLSYWLTRKKNYKLIAQNKIHQAVGTSGVQIGASAAGLGVPGLLTGALVGQLASLVNLLRRAGSQIWRKPVGARSMRELAAEHKKMPLLNGPNALVDSLRLNLIPMMVIAYFGASAQGQFGMAWRVLQMPLALINGALSQVFYQKLTTVHRGQMLPLVKRSVIRSALLGVVPFALIFLLSPPLLPVVTSLHDHSRYAVAGQLGALMVPWLFMNLVTSPISTVFVVVKRQGLMLLFAIVYAVVPVSVIYLLRPALASRTSVDVVAITRATLVLSLAMAVLLAALVLLTLWVSKQWDDGVGLTDAERAATDEGRDDGVAMAEAEVLAGEPSEPGEV